MNIFSNLVRVIVLIPVIYPYAVAASSRLSGCPDPRAISAGLKRLAEHDWATVSATTLQSVWPAELGTAECNAGSCQIRLRQDRVINDVCQCCELFNFAVAGEPRRPDAETRLRTLVVHYASPSRIEAIEAARMFASALGLRGADLKSVGSKPEQKFNWQVNLENRKDIALLEIHLRQQQKVWQVYLHFSRQFFDPRPSE